MKRSIFVIGLLLASKCVFADIHPFIGGNIGVWGANSELNSSLTGGGQVGVTGDYFGASFMALIYNKENKAGASEGALISKGNVSMLPIMMNAFIRAPFKKSDGTEVVAFRIGGGFSYISVQHDIDSILISNLLKSGFTLKEEIESGVGYQINGGLDFWLNNNFTLGVDIIYLFFNPDLKVTVTDLLFGDSVSIKTKLKLDSVIGLVALKYHF